MGDISNYIGDELLIGWTKWRFLNYHSCPVIARELLAVAGINKINIY